MGIDDNILTLLHHTDSANNLLGIQLAKGQGLSEIVIFDLLKPVNTNKGVFENKQRHKLWKVGNYMMAAFTYPVVYNHEQVFRFSIKKIYEDWPMRDKEELILRWDELESSEQVVEAFNKFKILFINYLLQ